MSNISSQDSTNHINPWFLWAKWNDVSKKNDTGKAPSYHPLLCHMIDVAVVTHLLWNDVVSPTLRQRWSATIELDQAAAGRWIAFWAGLHDLGKASPAFQLKRTDDLFRAQLAALKLLPQAHLHGALTKTPHGMISDTLLRDLLPEYGIARKLAQVVADAIGGHHGTFASPADRPQIETEIVGKGRWRTHRCELAHLLKRALDLPDPPSATTMSSSFALAFAGLVSVADWIGSNEAYFKHAAADASVVPQIDLYDYVRTARERAANAIDRLGWCGWNPPTEPRSITELFRYIDQPRPLQAAVAELLPRLNESGLVVIEAPMGEGKTEAALLLQDHWAATLGQAGSYIALPTQATSNGMFNRIRDFLQVRYDKNVVNLQLLHGHAVLSDVFQELQQHGDQLFTPEGVQGEPGRDGAPPNVIAAQWFTARKRGLLAPFGVGTIDQALLAVLPTKHGFVRLYGLAAKTVIIDEVHAYDTYMTTLMERLLCWLGALGSSVVLLSATLPRARREALLHAYARGAGWTAEPPPDTAPYPRLSWVTSQGMNARSIATSDQIKRTLHLRWVDGALPPDLDAPFSLGEQLRTVLSDGGCAAVICNTVGRAQKMYRALKRYFSGIAATGTGELDLLHARLLFADRDQRERRVLQRFGKDGTQRPQRAVVVATQVIEQSLDLDFDLIVTDHAPADLVLQRAGRLWRHPRDGRPNAAFPQPALWICAPTLDPHGVPQFEQGSTYVYDSHVLLRSWLELQPRATIAIPDQIEEIIEAVYDDRAAPDDLIEPLRAAWEATAQEQQAAVASEQRQAKDNYIKLPTYTGALATLIGTALEEDAPELHPAHQARTRLIEHSAPVICLGGTEDAPLLNGEAIKRSEVPTVARAKQLLQRSVTITHPSVVRTLLEQQAPSGWAKTPLLRNYRLLVFDEQNVARVGSYTLYLDPECGLIIGDEHA